MHVPDLFSFLAITQSSYIGATVSQIFTQNLCIVQLSHGFYTQCLDSSN